MDTYHDPQESFVKSGSLKYYISHRVCPAFEEIGDTNQYFVFWTRVYSVPKGIGEGGGK
jgi:hypothetical protein